MTTTETKKTTAAGYCVRVNGETVAKYLSQPKAAAHAQELRTLRPAANVVVLWL